jgi:hypothetical protein
MFVIDLISISIFGILLAFTVFKNLPERYLSNTLKKIIYSSFSTRFIPIWRFFAPIPATQTYHLLYRDWDYLSEDKADKWHEIIIPLNRNWYTVFWNPHKSFNKAILDISMEFIETLRIYKEHPNLIKISIPYLTILRYVSDIPRLNTNIRTQFLIMQSNPDTGYQIFYISEFHDL